MFKNITCIAHWLAIGIGALHIFEVLNYLFAASKSGETWDGNVVEILETLQPRKFLFSPQLLICRVLPK